VTEVRFPQATLLLAFTDDKSGFFFVSSMEVYTTWTAEYI